VPLMVLELADEIIEMLSLGAMLLLSFFLEDNVTTDDVLLLLAEIHAADLTAATVLN
jgi:hypothetical protein